MLSEIKISKFPTRTVQWPFANERTTLRVCHEEPLCYWQARSANRVHEICLAVCDWFILNGIHLQSTPFYTRFHPLQPIQAFPFVLQLYFACVYCAQYSLTPPPPLNSTPTRPPDTPRRASSVDEPLSRFYTRATKPVRLDIYSRSTCLPCVQHNKSLTSTHFITPSVKVSTLTIHPTIVPYSPPPPTPVRVHIPPLPTTPPPTAGPCPRPAKRAPLSFRMVHVCASGMILPALSPSYSIFCLCPFSARKYFPSIFLALRSGIYHSTLTVLSNMPLPYLYSTLHYRPGFQFMCTRPNSPRSERVPAPVDPASKTSALRPPRSNPQLMHAPVVMLLRPAPLL